MIRSLAALSCLAALLTGVAAMAQEASPAAEAPRFRAARSVHLGYPAPDAEVFYNEMTVTESHDGSYFMSCGWSHGYFGIQQIRGEYKVVIFSVWDPGQQNDPNIVDPEQRVRILHEGEDVRVSRFGGEGTGGKSMFPYDWKVGDTYRFMVRATPNGSRTAFAGYFYLNEEKAWKHLVTFETITGGEPLRGLYSFVEDFRRNYVSHTQVRRAEFGNGWVKARDGEWSPLLRARFTADRTTLSDNIDAGTVGERFYLVTGGETKTVNPLWGSVERADGKLPEDIPPPPSPAPTPLGS